MTKVKLTFVSLVHNNYLQVLFFSVCLIRLCIMAPRDKCGKARGWDRQIDRSRRADREAGRQTSNHTAQIPWRSMLSEEGAVISLHFIIIIYLGRLRSLSVFHRCVSHWWQSHLCLSYVCRRLPPLHPAPSPSSPHPSLTVAPLFSLLFTLPPPFCFSQVFFYSFLLCCN